MRRILVVECMKRMQEMEGLVELDSSQGRGRLWTYLPDLMQKWEEGGGVVIKGNPSFLPIVPWGWGNMTAQVYVGPGTLDELPRETFELVEKVSVEVDEPMGRAPHPVSGPGERIWVTTYKWKWKTSCSKPGDVLVVGGTIPFVIWQLLIEGRTKFRYELRETRLPSREERIKLLKLLRYCTWGYHDDVFGWDEVKKKVFQEAAKFPPELGIWIWEFFRRREIGHIYNYYLLTHPALEQVIMEVA